MSRGISVAEKKALLGEAWPLCECHSLPMKWKKRDCPAGGSWFCLVRIRHSTNKWKWKNIEKVRADDNRRAQLRKQDPAYLLKKTQYATLYKQQLTYEQATRRAEAYA